MNNPTVSIITPSFNRAYIINETAESIFKQTYPHWEWVIVDDGSTDESWGLLESFVARDSRVKIFKREREPKGACACRNIAVEESTGEYLIFLDTDDLLASFCLEQRVQAALESPQYDCLIFPMLLFKSKTDDMGVLWNIDNNEDEVDRLLAGNAICQGTGTLWKKKAFVDVGMWDEGLMLWQDVELHLRSWLFGVQFKKRMDLLPDVFLRISDVSLSRSDFQSLPKIRSRITVFRKTAEMIAAKDKLITYKEGLRQMGSNIITGSISNNHFAEADNLINFCVNKNLISIAEVKAFRRYISFRKFKLYKVPVIGNLFGKGLTSIIPIYDDNIGKVQWKGEIIA